MGGIRVSHPATSSYNKSTRVDRVSRRRLSELNRRGIVRIELNFSPRRALSRAGKYFLGALMTPIFLLFPVKTRRQAGLPPRRFPGSAQTQLLRGWGFSFAFQLRSVRCRPGVLLSWRVRLKMRLLEAVSVVAVRNGMGLLGVLGAE